MNKKDGSFNKLNFRTGIKDGLPIGLGYLSVSFAFGVQASLLGVPWFMSLFISATNLTSAGQLAGLTVIASAGMFHPMVSGASTGGGSSPLSGRSIGPNGGIAISHATNNVRAAMQKIIENCLISFI